MTQMLLFCPFGNKTDYFVKWDASSRWSFGPNTAWGRIGKTYPTLQNSFVTRRTKKVTLSSFCYTVIKVSHQSHVKKYVNDLGWPSYISRGLSVISQQSGKLSQQVENVSQQSEKVSQHSSGNNDTFFQSLILFSTVFELP